MCRLTLRLHDGAHAYLPIGREQEENFAWRGHRVGCLVQPEHAIEVRFRMPVYCLGARSPASSSAKTSTSGVWYSPIRTVVSVRLVPISMGTSAETAGESGSNGFRGSDWPSTTGARRKTPAGFQPRKELVDRKSLQLVHLPGFQAELHHEGLGSLSRVIPGNAAQRRAAFNDCAMEEAFRGRHRHQGADLHAAARLAEDRNVMGITAKGCDVVRTHSSEAIISSMPAFEAPAYLAPPVSLRYK